MNSWTSPVNIRPDHLAIVQEILRVHLPAGFKVWVFGSRANWTTKDSSDLDLAVEGAAKLDHKAMVGLEVAFEESNLPYTVDVVDLKAVSSNFKQIVEDQRVLLTAAGSGANVHGEWREGTLGGVIEFKRGYDLPQRDRIPGSVPLVSSSGVTDFHAEAKVKGPGVVTGRYGTLGEVFFIQEDFWPLNTALYVRDFKGNDPRFISYFLRSLDFSAYSDKAAVPGLNRNHLHEATVCYPTDIGQQRAIAHVLGTLDDKIELNRRMNRTLEEMARAIFQDWFVDFGPTRAKVEGLDPYLPPDLWDMFPDELVDSELGEIPEGWKVSELGKVATFPVRMVKPHDLSSETAYIGLDHVPRKSIALDEWESAGNVTSNKLSFKRGEFLFGKLRPYFHKVGLAPTDGICSTDIVVVSPKKELWSSFVLMCISTDEFVSYTDQTSNGTKMPRTSWKTMGQYEVSIPTESVAQAFQHISQDLLNRIATNIHEARALRMQRETLLPHMLSVGVKALEREASHAL